MATAGTLTGLALAFAGVRLLLILGVSELPRLRDIPFDFRVVLFALAALLATTFLIGLAPALRLARIDIRSLLNDSGRGATSARTTQRIFSTMIVGEIVVAITLVAGAGWLVRSFSNLAATDSGFTAQGRLIFDLFVPVPRYRTQEAATAWATAVAGELKGVGGVTAVASTSMIPFRAERDVDYYIGVHGEVDDPRRQITARLRFASPDFFTAMGVRLIAGREFTIDDRPGPATSIAIVNRAFVARYLHGRDPLKEPFYWGFPTVNRSRPYTVVGVVEDIKYASPGEMAEPTFYVPLSVGRQQTMVVASSLSNPGTLAAQVRAAIKKIDPVITVEPQPLSDLVAASLSRQRLGLTLMLIFAGAALLLAAIGIYGVIAYASAQRRGEVATRMALGATPSRVFWMLMNQGRTLSLIGATLGLIAAYAAGRVVTSSLYEVRASDPAILVAAVVIVVAISLIAVLIPARRAAQIDLARTLRLE